jgi:photosystem II stability/assembly factor-like uncharacterized protein
MEMMQRLQKWMLSAAPVAVIAALLYAGLFVKPSPHGGAIANPVFERGDQFYGFATTTNGTASEIWVAGSHGKIVRSTDSGRTWTPSTVPADIALQDIGSWSNGQVIAVGDLGVVLTSDANGKDWRKPKVPLSNISNKLLRVRTRPGGEAWAVGEGGVVLHTRNYGGTWQNVGAPEDVAWNDVVFEGKRGQLVGEFGRIKVTDDGGETWRDVSSPVKTSLMAVAFRDEKNGVAVGLGGSVLLSDDGGEHWKVLPSVTQEHLFDVAWGRSGWVAVGDKGVIALSGPSADHWNVSRVSDRERGWYARIAKFGSTCFLVGSSVTSMPNCAA